MSPRLKIALGLIVLGLGSLAWSPMLHQYCEFKRSRFEKRGVSNTYVADTLAAKLVPNWDLHNIGMKHSKALEEKISKAKEKSGSIKKVGKCEFIPRYLKYTPDLAIKKVDFYGHYLCPMEFEIKYSGLRIEIAKVGPEWHFADIRFRN